LSQAKRKLHTAVLVF